ncbi:FeoB-associated Cys-rich membrane protein [Lutispora sp.]|uniref:FeoB-associated Cys-rich membrane protein n=1 Tax=Lutispora sp. TaxID=2828727 RepID=UPI002B211F49|nr:FeoB-associated Cys-rich membrane protein [Lutispora sp.]MEA4961486.1 FeoB-associated Cys-rich membrane protein [Lutispora sp.]
MINYILGGIIFGLMILASINTIKRIKKESCACGGSCSGCHSKCGCGHDDNP